MLQGNCRRAQPYLRDGTLRGTTGLNPEFSARLAKLKAVPADQFDAYYLADMKQIHNNDEGLFTKEANDGTDSYKAFSHATAVLVKATWAGLSSSPDGVERRKTARVAFPEKSSIIRGS